MSLYKVTPYMAAILVMTAVLTGCASTSTPNEAGEASSSVVTPNIKVSGDTAIVPTEVLLGGVESEALDEADETPAAPFPEIDLKYRIGPGDQLRFRSFDDPELSMEVMVRYDGCISLQMIPDMKVEGLTREEAEDLIRDVYSYFYVEPQITLTITTSSSKYFTVMGSVASPREYPYSRPISLLDAITAAGGLRVNQRGGDSFAGGQGELVKALIIRGDGFEREVMEFDLRGYRRPGPSPAETLVLPGDIVYVPESANLVYLLGEVGRPSVYSITEGLTMLRLLALAGGFNETTGRLKHVVLIRQISEKETKISQFDVKQMLRGAEDVLLEPGDIIYIPRKRLVNMATFVQQLVAPASTGMSFANQVMNLYSNAYNTYYTKDRFDLLFRNNQTVSSATIIQNAILEYARQNPLQFGP